MDRAERVHLRALCEAATPGPWDAIYDEDAGEWMVRTGHADVAVLTWQQALDALGLSPVTMRTAAFIAASRAALPALLDDADAADARIAKAERERDEARAEVRRLRRELAEARGDFAQMREDRDALKGALARANELRIGDRAEARLDERWACSEFAEKWLREVGEITQDTPADLADAIRARGAGGAR